MARSRAASAARIFRVAMPDSQQLSAGDASVDSTSSRASDFGNTFHCRGDSIFSVGSCSIRLVEQQITIKMTQRRKLAPHAAPVHLMRKKLLQKFAHIIAPGSQQKPLVLLQELGKLQDVGAYRR